MFNDLLSSLWPNLNFLQVFLEGHADIRGTSGLDFLRWRCSVAWRRSSVGWRRINIVCWRSSVARRRNPIARHVLFCFIRETFQLIEDDTCKVSLIAFNHLLQTATRVPLEKFMIR